jgi:pilus assembly protein CpaE
MAKILVVDDDKDILRLLEFAIKRAGHQVISCADGEEGLVQIEAHQPDLIIADVMMPKMTGYEFCQQVRAQPSSQKTPIIVFSARFQPIDKQTALDAGATDYLPKSISPDELINRISEFLPAASTPSLVAKATVGFFSLRGGVGVTSLAVNSAIALSRTRDVNALLIDLAPLGGHAALMLGLRPTSSVAKALRTTAASNLTLEAIKPHLIEHSTGVKLLASTLNPEEQLTALGDSLGRLVNTLKPDFPLIIVDLPPILDLGISALLQQLDKIVLILAPDIPSLQSSAMALKGLNRLGVPANHIAVVVNQVIAQHTVPIDTIQNAIRRPITAIIPFESHMARATNSGTPLSLSHPESAGSKAIAQLANTLTAL